MELKYDPRNNTKRHEEDSEVRVCWCDFVDLRPFALLFILRWICLSLFFLTSQATANNAGSPANASSQYQYPFQNPALPIEERVSNIVSLMTLDEKIACLGTNPSVARLGIKGSPHVEGIHGLAQGGPANWRPKRIVPTTIFPQGIGMGETWDVQMLHQRRDEPLAG